jgi:uncharacterized RDD family membrane protein YckC
MAVKRSLAMIIFVRSPYQPVRELRLEEVNALLARGELDGDEQAWTAGLSDWIALRNIKGIQLPSPPPLPVRSPDLPPSAIKAQVDSRPVASESSPAPSASQEIAVTSRPKGKLRVERLIWARCWARLIDIGTARVLLELALGMACLALSIEIPYSSYPVLAYVGTFFLWLFLIMTYEALMLSTTSTTVGKWFLGICVLRPDGGRLSFNEAFWRANRAIGSGLYYLIFYPALTIFALYSNYKYAKEFQKLPWDLDGGPQVRGKAIGFIRHAFGFCLALVCAFAYFVIRQIIVKHSFRRDFIGN